MNEINKKIIMKLVKEDYDRSELESLKRDVAKQHQGSCPSNISLLQTYHKLVENETIESSEQIEKILRTRPVRSLSGIVNVSVLTKPYDCPGECIYCPQSENAPQSYVDKEPAVMRAQLTNYDPKEQVRTRIEGLKKEGHPTDKIELRIIGGTWSYYPKQYQVEFVKDCFDACNEEESETLEEAQRKNKEADHRIIGLSVETRPDYINKEEIKQLRELGVTRVELGVQTLSDKILKKVRRGHGVAATVKATKLLKDAGFKVSYQMMPDLPGSDFETDKETFKKLFSNQNYQPDLLKIYPTVVLEGTPLYEWYKEGKHEPYTKEELTKLIKEIKKGVPRYVRIQRIIRDVPTDQIVAGCTTSNLRQEIHRDMEQEDWQCNCIRCREVSKEYKDEPLELFRKDYPASDGKEIFLTFESEDRERLYSLLRLRKPSFIDSDTEATLSLKDSALIRELHTYGQEVPIDSNENDKAQHKGLGKKLIQKAEQIAQEEFGLNKIAIISGVGVRNYFRKRGYELQDTYMVKNL